MKAFLYQLRVTDALTDLVDELYVPVCHLFVNSRISFVGTTGDNRRVDSSINKKEIELTPEQAKNCIALAFFIAQKNQLEIEVRNILFQE
jgi:hypothetical protein